MGMPRITLILILLAFPALTGAAAADSISDAEDVPATREELRFINQVIGKVQAAAPVPDGWDREVGVTASGNTVREGKPVLIYERARNFPLKINMQLNFREVTRAREKREADAESAQQLQQEMMNAAMSGDMQKTQQLQEQLAAMMQAQMSAGAMGQAAGMAPVTPSGKPREFHVQIVVNGEGETIGREYDHPVPGVTRAFRVDKGDERFLSYKYYLGAWQVSESDRVNWRIVPPHEDQTAANHLRALAVRMEVYGDRESVEKYVKESLDLGGFRALLN